MRNRSAVGSANRSILLLTAIIVVAFVAVVYYSFSRNGDTLVQGSAASASTYTSVDAPRKAQSNFEEDSDGDGLANWEEVLWGTDPNNADTDGDGVRDKEDVFNTQNSTSLALDPTAKSFTEVKGTSEGAENSTEAVSQELVSSYMLSLQGGATTLSEQEQVKLAQGALRSAEPYLEAPRYTTSEVRVVPATKESRRVYIQSIRDKAYKMITGVTNEHEAIYQIGQGNIEWATNELTKTAEHYTKYVDEIRHMDVPSDAVSIHTNMVQAMLFYIYTLEGFTVINTDPLRSAVSTKSYLPADRALNQTYVALKRYIDTHAPYQNNAL